MDLVLMVAAATRQDQALKNDLAVWLTMIHQSDELSMDNAAIRTVGPQLLASQKLLDGCTVNHAMAPSA